MNKVKRVELMNAYEQVKLDARTFEVLLGNLRHEKITLELVANLHRQSLKLSTASLKLKSILAGERLESVTEEDE